MNRLGLNYYLVRSPEQTLAIVAPHLQKGGRIGREFGVRSSSILPQKGKILKPFGGNYFTVLVGILSSYTAF